LIKESKNYDSFKLMAVVNGIVSSGKSTFINALLGLNILPSKTGEATASIVIIENSPNEYINIIEYIMLSDKIIENHLLNNMHK
jgi:ribosome biogenesis GTPase A